MNWDVEAVNQLRELLEVKGFSASQAGRVMGCSRNAVISAAARRGLRLAGQRCNFIWDEQQVGRLREMAYSDMDAAACARVFGVSRSSIHNTAKRNNIPLKVAPPSDRNQRGRGGLNFGPRSLVSKKQLEPPTPLPFLAIEFGSLEPGQCRYPHGEGPYLFCGQPQVSESSYCGFHARICGGWHREVKRTAPEVCRPYGAVA